MVIIGAITISILLIWCIYIIWENYNLNKLEDVDNWR